MAKKNNKQSNRYYTNKFPNGGIIPDKYLLSSLKPLFNIGNAPTKLTSPVPSLGGNGGSSFMSSLGSGITDFFSSGLGINMISNAAFGLLNPNSNSTGVGNVMQDIGGLASNIPGAGGIIGAAVGAVGGLVNTAFGSNINEENVALFRELNKQLANYTSNASTNEELLADFSGLTHLADVNRKDVGSDGWFSDKAKNLTKDINTERQRANLAAITSLGNTALTVDTTNDLLKGYNYTAYGGPINMRYTGIMSPFGNLFKDGGIYIKPSKRGTFTAAAKKHGKSVLAFASQVLANKENYSPAMVKKANFARNAAKWHDIGGSLKDGDNTELESFWDKIDRWVDNAEGALALADAGLLGVTAIAPNPVTPVIGYGTSVLGGLADIYQGIRSGLKGDYANMVKNTGELGLSLLGAKAFKAAEASKDLYKSAKVSDSLTPVVKRTKNPRYHGRRGLPKYFKHVTSLESIDTWNNYLKSAGIIGANTISNFIDFLDSKKDNTKAFGGPLSDSEYIGIMEQVAKDNYKKWGFKNEDEALLHALNNNSYNYRGYYNKYPNSRANADTHWTDEFKTVYHPTFSNESIYSGKKSQYNPEGLVGGRWDYTKDETFIPASWQRNKKAFGGELTHGGVFSNGVLEINTGGTHELNPYQGIQVGVDEQNVPNLVEEGELIWNDYVFSNRLKVPKAVRLKYKLRGNKELSFADAAKNILKESEERPNDVISLNGLDAGLSRLAMEQELIRMKKELRLNRFDRGGHIKMEDLSIFNEKSPVITTPPPIYEPMSDEDEIVLNTGKSKEFKESPLRYAPIFRHAAGVINDIFSKPDYLAADEIRGIELNPSLVGFTPIANKLRYKPMDILRFLNPLNALASALRRNIMNISGGNRAIAMAGLLNVDQNLGNQVGLALISADEYNLASEERREAFNRATAQYNAEMGLKAAMANAESRNAMARARYERDKAAALLSQLARDAYNTRRSINFNILLEDLGNLGRERNNRKWLDILADKDVLKMNTKGQHVSSDKKEKKNGGKLNRKKKGGFTYA